MLAVAAMLPEHTTGRPSVILIHGAANSGSVWAFWQRALAEHGWASYALDLRGHGRSTALDLSHTRMADYAADVRALAPSAPARHRDPSVPLRSGEFGPEEYGITSHDPEQQPGMPDLDREERLIALASLSRESRLARDERQAGIVIESLPCPLLIVTGTADRAWPAERYRDLRLKADFLSVEGASHWGLVLSRRALTTTAPSVSRWMAQHGAG